MSNAYASPVLIERTRSAVTDGGGNYRIENLRPGSYTVTFTLTGFNTVKRERVELSGAQTVTIGAELKVGAVAETITVTGETPIVDLQSTTKQTVFNHDLLDVLPVSRTDAGLGALVVGANISAANVGDAAPNPLVGKIASVHGVADTRIMVNGVTTATLMGSQSNDMSFRNPMASQEVTVDTAAVSADGATGGARVNYIPRDGGNFFKATLFATYSNDSLQGDNFTQRVKDLGLRTANSNRRSWDINPGAGGPILRDKLWFWATGRSQVGDTNVGGTFFNLNANNPAAWTYVADTSRQGFQTGRWWDAQGRLTWQVNNNNKIAVSYDRQGSLQRYNTVSATVSPESALNRNMPVQSFYHGEWSSPLTNRLLAEVVVINRHEIWGVYGHSQEFQTASLLSSMIPVVAQNTNLRYHGGDSYGQFPGAVNRTSVPSTAYRVTLSYVTGAHSIKVGYNDQQGYLHHDLTAFQPLAYRVNNSAAAIPNQLTEYAWPLKFKTDLDHDWGIYAQDRWTIKRATVTYGLRWD
ncbi:MAG: hypothetical protein A3G76_04450 [Acidobacteria bacterium RIFCSPLOWO2_12_FULL_65_11]|nr:MAG: hypothetical protein A3H95_00030 [Acidobacteria bacterium RIFCSPLOWO2_02_FULL_64_15]OFW30637.1 MAG: hypothetical protein A3G76_04450 [Acidobacteria bacterium RIFCSPLOWO2_12_FULL_65_11]